MSLVCVYIQSAVSAVLSWQKLYGLGLAYVSRLHETCDQEFIVDSSKQAAMQYPLYAMYVRYAVWSDRHAYGQSKAQ